MTFNRILVVTNDEHVQLHGIYFSIEKKIEDKIIHPDMGMMKMINNNTLPGDNYRKSWIYLQFDDYQSL